MVKAQGHLKNQTQVFFSFLIVKTKVFFFKNAAEKLIVVSFQYQLFLAAGIAAAALVKTFFMSGLFPKALL